MKRILIIGSSLLLSLNVAMAASPMTSANPNGYNPGAPTMRDTPNQIKNTNTNLNKGITMPRSGMDPMSSGSNNSSIPNSQNSGGSGKR